MLNPCALMEPHVAQLKEKTQVDKLLCQDKVDRQALEQCLLSIEVNNDDCVNILINREDIDLILFCIEEKHLLRPTNDLHKWLLKYHPKIHHKWYENRICVCTSW